MIPRFHCPEGLAPGATVALPPTAAHHAARVLRLRENDPVIVFDGRGGEWSAVIARIRKEDVHVVLRSFDATERELPVEVVLVQAIPAADKMDWIVQKCVELGVAAIRPVVAKRSVVRLSGERMERRVAHWRGVAASACEQCGRNRVPEVADIVDLPQYLAEPSAENEARWLLAPGETARLRELPSPAGRVVVAVGPEGGFEEGEMAALRASGFRPLGLGRRVLRTETAGAAALAAILALWGD